VLRAPLLVAERVAFLQVGAGAKRLVPGPSDDRAAVPLFVPEALEKFTQLERHPRIEGIGDLGAVERRQENVVRPVLHPERGILPHACLAEDGASRPALTAAA
jgi:hypothetical protein